MDSTDELTEARRGDTAVTDADLEAGAKSVGRTIADAMNAIGAEVAELRWNAPADTDVRLAAAVEQLARHAAVLGLAAELLDMRLAAADGRIASQSALLARLAGEPTQHPRTSPAEHEPSTLLDVLTGCPDEDCKYLAGQGLQTALTYLHLSYHAAKRRPEIAPPAFAR